MRPPFTCLGSFSLALLFSTQLPASPPAASDDLKVPLAASSQRPSLRDAALETLLSERRSPQALDEAAAAARKHGVSEQAVLEARFLFHVDRRDDAAIAAMLPEMLARRETFKLEDSAICSVREDWLGIVEYVQAIVALRNGDRQGFKSHITEAFWFSPGQASAYAPHIEALHTTESMNRVTVDFQSAFTSIDSHPSGRLADLLDGKKALLLHFWSPWSTECEQSLPDFITTAAHLQKHGVAVLSLVSDVPAHLADEARETLRGHASAATAGRWGADLSSRSLARLLCIRQLPCVVLLTPDGKVSFNGFPTDEVLWQTFKKIDPTIDRPKSALPSPGQ